MCDSAIHATMLVLYLNVTVSVNKFTCASARLERSLDQLGRHINIIIIIINIIIQPSALEIITITTMEILILNESAC